MEKVYKVDNITCEKCASTIKNYLGKEFGIIKVNLNISPREVNVNIKNKENEQKFFLKMKEIGFNIVKE